MSRRTDRKQRQKQQKQLSQSSQPSQPPPQEQQQQQQEPQTPPWRRSPNFTKTLETIDEGHQTEFRPAILPQEPQEEHPSSRALRTTKTILLLEFIIGCTFAWATHWLMPEAARAMYLALQVFVAEMANLVMRLPLELMMLLHRLLTGRWSFLDYLVMIVLMSLLIGYFGTRYLLRQELAQYNPHGDGYVSEESDEDTYTIGIASEDEISETYFAMAA
ncbi:uncharacterized protein TrAFT101_005895 [Trichoderma asperellum]|uniref:Uncharacterized protein n=1 Tax=Trichoderma asperellum (strain ATCC 204424 / CBS 433.97 / NBRC 101777) TaxID=1042311 RepID=A0A2T3Z7E2_TRIA4|nr:hypothetical protein M441DRAFT_47252 [Trichoderma asperellum CBS 433.97]PTB40729.1 hypothetical protein M441DRAFT_47252 [Trichoderma asperellum CBS 433.97]UKZ90896.1 hypothetical protein TrAFT101_005895 [Trichoderma asperellum]